MPALYDLMGVFDYDETTALSASGFLLQTKQYLKKKKGRKIVSLY